MEQNMRTILLTGMSGFIGYHIALQLIEKGWIVYGIDNINSYYSIELKYARLKMLGIENGLIKNNEFIRSSKYENLFFSKSDITNLQALTTLMVNVDFNYVCHLAAQAGIRYSLEMPQAYIDSNITGFLNILELSRLKKIHHLLFASSSSVYGNTEKMPLKETDPVNHPVSIYAVTKRTNELMAHTYNYLYHLPVTGIRFFTVYGPFGRPDMAPMLFADSIMKGRSIEVFNYGNLDRDFTYISDIVNGILLLLEKPPQSVSQLNLFNLGNSKPVHLLRFIECLEKEIGRKAVMSMREMQPGDVLKTYADVSKLKDYTNYTPSVQIEDGIQLFLNWYKEYYSITE
jgi:UDP-glucuronate 4-epimerase